MTSVTGQRTESGFTLIELMVVLVIAGTLFASAIVFFPSHADQRIDRSLTSFQRLIAIAQERALLEARPYAVGIWGDGYAFYRFDGDWGWQPLTEDRLLHPREWPAGLWLDLYLDGLQVGLPLAQPPSSPQVPLYADGQVRPFRLHLFADAKAGRWLSIDATGQVDRNAKDS